MKANGMQKSEKRILIAYFSHSGNTRLVAEKIKELTLGTLYEIKTEKPYPQDYNTVVDLARTERSSNYRPKLSSDEVDLSKFDVIILGYPNWWSTMPMANFTFLESLDFAGKTLLPYCTHEGSGLGISEREIAKTCPTATLLPGLQIRGSRVATADVDIANWLRKNQIID
jgi:flavodoxin